MSPKDDPYRDHERRPERQNIEDNPFIAFRRFADSQVSSLLNTVITLPATIANFNNAHVAREQCLFGRADKRQCHQLAELEAQVADLRSEGRELYRVGDIQAMIKKGERLMQLDQQAEELRRNIVEAARSRDSRMEQASPFDERGQVEAGRQHQPERRESPNEWRHTQSKLMEKVANEKGQQWGWMWDWGFPRPFDAEDDNIWPDSTRKNSTSKPLRADFPTTAGSQLTPQEVQAQIQSILDDIGTAIAREVPRIFASPWYSPSALERDEMLNSLGITWRDAFEDLIRAENGAPLMPSETLGQHQEKSYDEWARRFHDPKTAREEFAAWVAQSQTPKSSPPSSSSAARTESHITAEEPSYEYGHDHEDQHDDDPETSPHIRRHPKATWFSSSSSSSNQDTPETELDAYERLLGRTTSATHPSNQQKQTQPSSSSILSTLTTTERTVAADGTVTTKVVLKKRFTDGTEESSETVHTQRGNNDKVEEGNTASSAVDWSDGEVERKRGKSGWFWSG